jgi:heme exporter protein A
MKGVRPVKCPAMSATPTSPPLLECHGLCFARNEEPIFGPIELRVAAGEALLVKGGNGAGKTTLLRVLAGLLTPTAGDVQALGKPVDSGHLARGCAYLGHLHGHKGDLTALENLVFSAALLGADRNPESVLAEVGLSGHEDHQARRLSAGQNKRLALARLRLSPAKLWLLDEPYANLDLDGIALVNRLIAMHLDDGGGALLTTHGAYAAPPVPIRTLELSP